MEVSGPLEPKVSAKALQQDREQVALKELS